MKIIFSLFVLCFSSGLFAQSPNIEIIKDPRLDGLVRKQSYPTDVNGIPQIPGYRVQLVFDSDKRKIDELRGRYISMNPTVDTYVSYNAPNYVLKAGDCKTHNDAQAIRDAALRTFPTAFIIREMINLPRFE